jgi:prepilin-type N-terminal cleavage/methylation domain-containing protein
MRAAFTLIELLIVTGIIALLMALVIPAFTNIKSGSDVTSAAYTIKGVLDTARTYAKANNTYVWVGFYEENVSQLSPNSATPKIGRLVMSIVASNDGTMIYNPSIPGTIDPTRLLQVGKLTKIDNVHLATNLPSGSGAYPGSTFGTRPPVASTYRIADTANSTTPFQYPLGNPAPAAQYTFVKAVQFSPGGEARINNSTNTPQTAAEVGLEPTYGAAIPSPTPANLVAIQITGVGGNVAIYQK